MKTPTLDEGSNLPATKLPKSHHKLSLSTNTQTKSQKGETLQVSYREIKSSVDQLKSERLQNKALSIRIAQETEEKLKQTRDYILKIDRKLEKLENSNKKLENSIACEKYLRIEEFKSALQPLQSSADLIENTKTQLSSQIENLKKDLNELKSTQESKKEELDKKAVELNHANFELQVCRRKIEEIAKEHTWDYIEVFQESKARTKVKKMKEEKKRAKKALIGLESEVQKLKTLIEDQSSGELLNPESILQKTKKLEKEIEQLEEFLNLKSTSHSCKRVWEVIKELAAKENVSITDIISKEQVNLVKQKKLDLLDRCKNLEWDYENRIFDLNVEIKELEIKFYENVKNEASNSELEKNLQNKKKELNCTSAEHEVLKKKHSVKFETLDKWLENNRKLLTLNQVYKFPDDEAVIQEFLIEFSIKKVEKSELGAIRSVISRYLEKVKERDSLFELIADTKEGEKKAADEKTALLLKVKAEIKSKTIEIEKLQNLITDLQNEEKLLIKQLETYKLEIDAGRRKDVLELISKAKLDPRSFKNHAAIEEIKSKYNETVSVTTQSLRRLCETKSQIKESGKQIENLIRDVLKPAYTSINKEISVKSAEIKRLEDDFVLLESSKEELLDKLGAVANRKKEELIHSIKDMSKKHGCSQFQSIEKLYALRSKKEAELLELELQSIRHQKAISENEVTNSLELFKMTTKAEVLKKEISVQRKNEINRKQHLSCIDLRSMLNEKAEMYKSANSQFGNYKTEISNNGFSKNIRDRTYDKAEMYKSANSQFGNYKTEISNNGFSKNIRDRTNPGQSNNAKFSSLKSNTNKSMKSSPQKNINNRSIKTKSDLLNSNLKPKDLEILKKKYKSFGKLPDEFEALDSLRSSSITPECSYHLDEFALDSVFEIPLPKEPKFSLAEGCSETEKKIFRNILYILEGSVLYKKQPLKGTQKTVQNMVQTFDPLEFRVKPPEDCGYALRKIRVNKQLTKIETRLVGKPGIESFIMIDTILAVGSSNITNSIIKAQNIDVTGWDQSLENLAKCSKEYRENKYKGKINYSSQCFVLKSKETSFYPFYISLKTGKLELIAESISDYIAWIQGLECLIKNRSFLEKLKFKIQVEE